MAERMENSWILHPERQEETLLSRLLGNLLLFAPRQRTTEQSDPEIAFLKTCPGFALVICAVSYYQDHAQTMQELVLQQTEAYGMLADALRKKSHPDYFCLTTELENQMVALLIPRRQDGKLRSEFPIQLRDYLGDSLRELISQRGIPLYTVYTLHDAFTRLNQSYTKMKNAIVFQDYLQSGIGKITEIGELLPRPHIGLWNQLDAGSVEFSEAFLHNDPERACACVNQIIDTIIDWLPPSKDNLLADVQYFFDSVFSRLTAQFGEELLQGITVTDAIFESESIMQLRSSLAAVVHRLFENARKNTSDSTFQTALEIRNYMTEHIRDYDLTLAAVAEHFSMSPQLLSIQFKRCFHTTPSQYLEQERMELVKDYLIHTNLSMEKICELVGMGSVSTLHRVFRKQCGQSPGLFRQAAKMRSE